MTEALVYLNRVISPQQGTGMEFDWEDILGAVDIVFAEPFNRETERVMLAALRFAGPVRLAESSEIPHSMAPEEMLKSFAVQWLARETGLTHLLEMRRVQAMAVSPLLGTAVRAVIQEAAKRQSAPREFELVTLWGPTVQPVVKNVMLGTISNPKIGSARPAKAAFTPQSAVDGGTAVHIPLNANRRRKGRSAVVYDRGLTSFPGYRKAIRSPEAEAAAWDVARKRAYA